MRLSELTSKDVINDKDGCRLGKVVDLDIDENFGKIKSIIIGWNFNLIKSFKKDHAKVDWSKIIKVGNDVIIVSHPTENKGHKEQKT